MVALPEDRVSLSQLQPLTQTVKPLDLVSYDSFERQEERSKAFEVITQSGKFSQAQRDRILARLLLGL